MGCNTPEAETNVSERSFSINKKDGETATRTFSFNMNDSDTISVSGSGGDSFVKVDCDKVVMERSLSFKKWEPDTSELDIAPPFKNIVLDSQNVNAETQKSNHMVSIRREMPKISLPEPVFLFSPRPISPKISLPEPAYLSSPRPMSELDAAAVTLQKVYKSYRTRRNLADCAVVVEELWWKALDFASLEHNSVSFFNIEKHETAVSRWTRAGTRMAKVGKGLSKDEKARKLALQHWLEAIDPRHRYGHNLHFYYDVWFDSESTQPFFYWLDIGDGKRVNIQKCLRSDLHRQCIEYLGPKERECYEVIVESGKLVYRQSGMYVNTIEGSKWIFVLSTSRSLYVGKKKKGRFQHSSFLAGGATTAAGRLIANEGILEAVWPYSGHYHPTEENFNEFLSFLEEHNVDLTNVKKCATDEDSYTSKDSSIEISNPETDAAVFNKPPEEIPIETMHDEHLEAITANSAQMPAFEFGRRLSCKWSTGAGPRIGCVRDYPNDLQCLALEQVNLSPRITPGAYRNNGPIPSPRPSPKIRLSPRLAYMGLPSPRTPIPAAN